MGKTFEGKLDGKDLRIGIVASRFNCPIAERLLEGSMNRLTRSNVESEAIDVCNVPGALEVPKASKATADTVDQAIERADNKGSQAAGSWTETANVLREIQ